MMNRRLASQLLAIVLVSLLWGWWLSDIEAADMARYRTLSHQQLLAALASNNETHFLGHFLIGMLLIGCTYFIVDGLAKLILYLWSRVWPLGSAQTDPSPS